MNPFKLIKYWLNGLPETENQDPLPFENTPEEKPLSADTDIDTDVDTENHQTGFPVQEFQAFPDVLTAFAEKIETFREKHPEFLEKYKDRLKILDDGDFKTFYHQTDGSDCSYTVIFHQDILYNTGLFERFTISCERLTYPVLSIRASQEAALNSEAGGDMQLLVDLYRLQEAHREFKKQTELFPRGLIGMFWQFMPDDLQAEAFGMGVFYSLLSALVENHSPEGRARSFETVRELDSTKSCCYSSLFFTPDDKRPDCRFELRFCSSFLNHWGLGDDPARGFSIESELFYHFDDKNGIAL